MRLSGEPIDFEETSTEPEVDTPPEEPPPQKIQGLSRESFVLSNAGISVRAGNTTATKATNDLMDLEDANEFHTVPFTAVAKSPKVKRKPPLVIPPLIIEQKIQGRVELLVTVDREGKVSSAKVHRSLSKEADAACVTNAMGTRWRPGEKNGQAISVSGVPYSCRFEMAVE